MGTIFLLIIAAPVIMWLARTLRIVVRTLADDISDFGSRSSEAAAYTILRLIRSSFTPVGLIILLGAKLAVLPVILGWSKANQRLHLGLTRVVVIKARGNGPSIRQIVRAFTTGELQTLPKLEVETAEQAKMILGLKEGFTKTELDQKHRRLIQSVHPDIGGSDLLAQQVNGAKAVLYHLNGWRK